MNGKEKKKRGNKWGRIKITNGVKESGREERPDGETERERERWRETIDLLNGLRHKHLSRGIASPLN